MKKTIFKWTLTGNEMILKRNPWNEILLDKSESNGFSIAVHNTDL